MDANEDLQAFGRYASGELPTIDDHQAEAIYAAGHIYYEQESFARAADVFRLLALARPHEARSWIGLGATHEAVGEWDRAGALYAIAVQARDARLDERATAILYLARAEQVVGNDDDAREHMVLFRELVQDLEMEPSLIDIASSLERALNTRSTP
jgi:Flp pilus assembly protein TadD